MKLSDYAKKNLVCYKTAWNRYKAGKIKNTYLDETGHIIIDNSSNLKNRAIVYARVSNNNRKESLTDQQKFLETYCSNKGYDIIASYKEIASGMNDDRKILQKILQLDTWDILVIENKDRLTRFGFNYILTLLEKEGKRIEVVNKSDNDKQDLISDLVSIVYSFSARLYGKRKAKRKEHIEKFIKECN